MVRKLFMPICAALAMGLFLTAAPCAKADPLSVFNTAVTDVGAEFQWDYSVFLSPPGEHMDAGDFFTIYDFGGYTGTHDEDPGWDFSTSLVDVSGVATVDAGDDPSIVNLTWTRTGGATGPGIVGGFSANSLYQAPTLSDFFGQSDLNSTTGGQNRTNHGSLDVPVVPEPASIALLGLGTVGFAGFGLRRRKNKV